jgi:DNA-binding SARP family transcriptional activator
VEYDILGPLVVRHDGTTVPIGAPKLRTLLLRLLVDAGRTVTTDRLVDDLWDGEPPPGAVTSLRAYVSNLRRLLSEATGGNGDGHQVVTGPRGYAFEVDPAAVDATVFETALERGRTARRDGAESEALAQLDTALGLWRGPALADVEHAAFAQPTIQRLEELRRLAEEERFAAMLALGRHEAAVADLERFVAVEPLRERPRRQLTLALYRAGRAPEALQVHRAFRDTLIDELGLDPSPRFDDLVARILRRDPSLDLPRPTPTAGDPDARPTEPASSSARVTGAPGAPGATPIPPASHRPLVGRERERRQLERALARLAAGRGGLVLFGGEPGIGKTTLLEELEHLADGLGTVHWGRCPETEGAPAFWPWTCLLRSVAEVVPPPIVDAAVQDAPMVAHLLPSLADRAGVALPPAGDDLAGARFSLYDATARFVRHLVSDTGLVLVLDDLHWADPPSLELLAFLAAQLADDRVLLAGSYRDAPADRTDALEAALATVARHPAAVDLRLEGLSTEQVAAIAADTIGQPLTADAAVDLRERTNGNPFFVTQLARLLDEATRDPSTPIPVGVRHVIARRLALLPAATQGVLEVASVVGRSFDARIVAAAMATPVDVVVEALDPAYAHGLLAPTDTHAGAHAFVHALIRETLHDGLSPATTARLHAAVATALAAAGTASADELAEHFWIAGALAPPGALVQQTLAAADDAIEVLAYERAEAHLRRALDLLVASDDVDQQIAVRTRLVSLLTSVAGWAHPDIREIAGAVTTLAGEVGLRPDLLPLWHLSWTSQTTRGDARGGRATAVELLARAEAAGDELHRAMATSMRSYGDLHLGGDHAAALAGIVAARDALDRQPDVHLAATPEHLGVTVRLAEVTARALSGDPDTLPACERLLGYATAVGRPFPLVAAYLFAAWSAAVAGDPDAALRWSSAGLELCERYRFRQTADLLLPVNGWARAQLGDDPAAQVARISEAVQLLEEAGHLHVLAQWHVLLADTCVLAGDVAAARASLDRARNVIAATEEVVYLPQVAAMAARIEVGPGASAVASGG